MRELLQNMLEKLGHGEPFALVTAVETQGSVPVRPGARMIVSASETAGTIGGGALEYHVVQLARSLAQSSTEQNARLIDIDVASLGMCCGGQVKLFIELFSVGLKLWIFGGGHIAQALVPLAANLKFQVTVVDNRREYATEARLPQAARVLCGSYAEIACGIPSDSFAVITTHGHTHDEEVLAQLAAIKPPLPYIGMIGSRTKVVEVFHRLKRTGLDLGPQIYSPIGLDLGGNSPGEIALSIISEIVGVLHQKPDLPHSRKRIAHSG